MFQLVSLYQVGIEIAEALRHTIRFFICDAIVGVGMENFLLRHLL